MKTVALVFTALLGISCAQPQKFASSTSGSAAPSDAGIARAVAILKPAKDLLPAGTVVLEPAAGGLKVSAEIRGLKPNGEHGFHIHEFGDCSNLKAKSPGVHFNPDGFPHGAPTDPQHHAGSFGNIKADAKGVGRMEFVKTGIALGGARNVLGRAVIVHAQRDDLKSQPSGNAGDFIACGVIGVAKTP